MTTLFVPRISQVKFSPPLSETDIYHPVQTVVADVNFTSLKEQVYEKALSIVRSIEKIPSLRIEEKILSFLTNDRYCHPETKIDGSHRNSFLNKLQLAINRDQPINLILSLFPCKGCHPLRTFASQGSEVYLSEIAALLRLYELASGIGILYSPGASITILSNGIRYSDVFCEPETK